jgi:hypothetical protein
MSGAFNYGTAGKDGMAIHRNPTNYSSFIAIQASGANPNLMLSKRTITNDANFVVFNVNGTTYGRIRRNGSAEGIFYATTSDVRLKENMRATHYSIDDLMKINVKDYNYISDSTKSREIGFIAQQLHEIYPDAVTVGGEDAKADPWTVDYGKVTPLLVKAIQDQQKEIEALKETINVRLAVMEQNAGKKKEKLSKRERKNNAANKVAVK